MSRWGRVLVALGVMVWSVLATALEARLDDSRLRASFQMQALPVWCWVASVQMALRYYGIDIDQPTLIKHTFGPLPPVTGDFIADTQRLNQVFYWKGRRYIISASASPVNGNPLLPSPWAITPEAIVNHLKRGRPLVLGYASAQYSLHTVLLTGVDYSLNATGHVQLRSLRVVDPYPYNQAHVDHGGVIDYSDGQLPGPIVAVWQLDITAE